MNPTYKANKEIFLYNLKSTPSGFQMAKLDSDWNVAAVYNLAPSRNGHFSCDCPANARAVITKLCKHRRMLPMMLGAVNTDRFYDPERGAWCQPLGDPHRVDPEQVVGEAAHPEATAKANEGEALGSPVSVAGEASVIKASHAEIEQMLAPISAARSVAPTLRRR